MDHEDVVFERVLEVSSNNEHILPVTGARVRLNAGEVERLLELATIGEQHKVASITDWNYAAEWGFLEEDEGDDEPAFIPTEDGGDRNLYGPFRSECNQVCVSASGETAYVRWQAYWKHTDVKVSTGGFEIAELREALAAATGSVIVPLSGPDSIVSCSSTQTETQRNG